MTYRLHILAGGLGLAFGFVALYAAKGGLLHRRSGILFVFAMLPMCRFGLLMAAARNVAPAINIPAALLTAYLVVTALTTVRPPGPGSRWLDLGGLGVALGVGLAPKLIRIRPLLALPVLAVLVTMTYWLWRVRRRRSLRGLAVGGVPEAA